MHAHHRGHRPPQRCRYGAGILWNGWNWRCNSAVDHTLRLAVRAFGTSRILGNGVAELRSPPNHLELAQVAFTISRPRGEEVGLTLSDRPRAFWAEASQAGLGEIGLVLGRPALCCLRDGPNTYDNRPL